MNQSNMSQTLHRVVSSDPGLDFYTSFSCSEWFSLKPQNPEDNFKKRITVSILSLKNYFSNK